MGPRVLTEMKDIQWKPPEERPKLKTAMKSLQKAFKKKPRQAHPMKIKDLRKIQQIVDFQNEYEETTFTAMILAFFGILRVANVTVKNRTAYDHKDDLSRKSFINRHGQYGLIIKKSKTITRRERQHISWIPQIPYATEICPVNAILDHICTHQDKTENAPLLQIRGKALTKHQFKKTYNILLGRAGLCCRKLTPHALRRGGATFGSDIGMGPRWLKGQGDWRSAAYKLYIKNSKLKRAKQAKKWTRRAKQYILGK